MRPELRRSGGDVALWPVRCPGPDTIETVLIDRPTLLASLEAAAAAREPQKTTIELSTIRDGEPAIKTTFVDYEENPLEIALSSITTTLRVRSRVWKEPAFFLAHPDAIAAFARECTACGVLPPTVALFGSQFLTWRGVALVPSDKCAIDRSGPAPTTRMFLVRAGQGPAVPRRTLAEGDRLRPRRDRGDQSGGAVVGASQPPCGRRAPRRLRGDALVAREALRVHPGLQRLGTLVPVAPMVEMAHRHGARVLVDGAQSASHLPVDVTCLGADFFLFSGHKVYGPTGIGVLYGREDVLERMPPWQGGGSMIDDVSFERTTYAQPPARFEAGTPSPADAVGPGAALDYVERIGRPAIAAHEQHLMSRLVAGLSSVPGVSILGAPAVRVGAVSFVLARYELQAVGEHLNRCGIAVRSGHHWAQPILRRFGHEISVRPSLGLYNDEDGIARLVVALRDLAEGRRR